MIGSNDKLDMIVIGVLVELTIGYGITYSRIRYNLQQGTALLTVGYGITYSRVRSTPRLLR
jgi:hypothetical protein